MRTKRMWFILIPVIGWGGGYSAAAATWHIVPDGSGDATTIQAGIDAAGSGDTVLLAAGTFTGPGNFEIDFRGKRLTVVSESGPAQTIIDCNNSGRGFVFDSNEDSNAILSGVTITNGLSMGKGGGVFCNKASPQILNNVIAGNHANKHGGGIYISKGSPTVSNNTIVGNSTDQQGGGILIEGGATPTISNNIVVDNQGEGIACRGAGTNPVVECSNVFGNTGGDAICGTDGGNNMAVDPEFCGIDGSGNFYLQSDSPHTAGNSPCGERVGALPILCGTVSTEHKTWGAIKSMYHD